MNNERYVVVDNEAQVIEKLAEFKKQGVGQDDMYIIHNKGEKISILGTKIDVDTIEASDEELNSDDNKSVLNKLTDFFTGDDRVEKALDDTVLTDEEKERVLTGVRNGKIAILVDKDYRDNYCKVCTEYKSTEEAKQDKLKTGYEPFLDIGIDNIF